jgi:hypothetical protein
MRFRFKVSEIAFGSRSYSGPASVASAIGASCPTQASAEAQRDRRKHEIRDACLNQGRQCTPFGTIRYWPFGRGTRQLKRPT